ncbi:MAG: tetratricopeptide repeat protein [Pirellulales bacterium]|nr:tetratricopeptide repeat protein [Pirellulales bacterium]
MSTVAPPLARRPWIVGPWWDLAYLVVTPLAIVPVVLILVRQWLTPEQVSLAVIAFASLGHHLPGFMRAYGDQELFARFRRRFLLAPPLLLAGALLFTPPTVVRNALGISWTHLHGLELILLVWGTWHGLMQTFGFMRIYDIRRGVNDRWTARLDHWLCLAIFVCGVVFSDARVYGVANGMMQAGLPEFGPESLAAMRIAVAGASAIVALLYVANLIATVRRGDGVNWIKLLLAAMTGWFYWYCGRLSTNLIIGIAMFEIYHAVQYDAIVWIYNRRLLARAGERFGPLGFLFRDRWTTLSLYLAAIAAYSAARLISVDTADYVFRGGPDVHQWLVALFATSTLLHFYYDGFIWKVSERRTQENLVDDPRSIHAFEHLVPGLKHAAKWSLLTAAAAWFIVAEIRMPQTDEVERDRRRLAALWRLVPDLPELQLVASRARLEDGAAAEAIALAREAVALRPESHEAKGDLAYALMSDRQYAEARPLLAAARAAEPRRWRYATDLGITLAALGEPASAERQLRTGVALAPAELEPRMRLAEFLLAHGQPAAAVEQLEAASRLGDDDPTTQIVLGAALSAAGAYDRAAETLQAAATASPDSVDANYQLGLLRLRQNQPNRAVAPLRRAVALAPDDFASRMQLGDAFFALGKWQLALDAYLEAAAIDPDSADALLNMGSALVQTGRLAEAEEAYRRGLELAPESKPLRYNLGMLLNATGRTDEGRTLLEPFSSNGAL